MQVEVNVPEEDSESHLLSQSVPDIVPDTSPRINFDLLTMKEKCEVKSMSPPKGLLHHCLPITNIKLLEGTVLVTSEGPSMLLKMAYLEKQTFQRYQLFPNQFIISGMDFVQYPVLECGDPVEWHKRSDKPYDYIYVGFVWAGSVGTLVRITRSKKGDLKVLEFDNGENKNELMNFDFIPVAAKWLKGGNVLALLSVLNYLVLYERSSTEDGGTTEPKSFTNLKEVLRVKCTKSETLFSGKIFEDVEGDIRVFGGTIFNGICVWDVVGNEAVIKHELKCHDGIIFSLEYHHDKSLLLSTSDDRTVAVWKFSGSKEKEQVELLHRLYGHDARVWKALCVRSYIISVGESSDVRVNILEDGKEHKVWNAHDGAPIFNCTYDEDLEILYTVGSDGSIRKWPKWWFQLQPRMLPFDKIPFDPKTDDKNKIQGSGRWIDNKDFPKRVALLDLNHIVVAMESGRMIGITWEGKQFDLLYDSNCEGYQILKVSPDHKRLAVAGKDGYFFTAQISFSENESSKCTVLHAKKIFQTRVSYNILSIIWVSSSRLILVCSDKAIAIIFTEDKDGEGTEAQLIQTFQLKFQRPGVATAVEIFGKYLVLGDEVGTLHLFRYHKTNEAIHKFDHCHKDGVTGLLFYDSKLYSSGRDGKIRQFSLNIDQDDDMKAELVPLTSYPMPFDWIAGICRNMGQILIYGYQKEDFIIQSFNEKRTLAKIPCGVGGSRKWDFKYGHGLDGSPNASFAFVKDKEIFYTFLPMTAYLGVVMKEGLHSRTINCGIIQGSKGKTRNSISYLTGSEDGTIKWFEWDGENRKINCIQNMENHVSSVRVVVKITLEAVNKTFIFTGGGRSQLCIYSLDTDLERIDLLKEIILVKTKCKQTEGDVRIMDICVVHKDNDEICCFGACSDGFVRVLYFNSATHKFKIVGALKGNDHAVMKVQVIKSDNLNGPILICGVTSNGYLIIWRWNTEDGNINRTPIEKGPEFMKLLRRTAFLSMTLAECQEKEKYSLVCGGDDCSVSFWCLNIHADGVFDVSHVWTRDQIQRGAVVGVHIAQEGVYSISNDQIVGFWSLEGELRSKMFAGVSDCQGFVVDTENNCVLCYGKGVSWVPLDVKE